EQQLVQEPAPPLGIGLDQPQVLGREEHRPHLAQQIAQPRHVLPLQPRPVRPARGDLELHLQRPPGTAEARPDDRGAPPALHGGGTVGHTMADSVARYQTASTMLVLPWPFWPTSTVMPGRNGRLRRG